MKYTYNMDSLKRGKVTPPECLEVLADDTKGEIDEGYSKRGFKRTMYVGKTNLDRCLEVGVEFFSDAHEHIYHARKAKKATKEKARYEE